MHEHSTVTERGHNDRQILSDIRNFIFIVTV